MGKVKVGVIGAGWWGAEVLIPTLARRDDVVLDGVSRLGAAELARVKEHFGFAFASEDFRAVLARKPDAVIVASPHALHYEHAKVALEGGAHVLVEKPMAVDPREGWALATLAERQGRQLLVSNGYHYLPGIAALQERLAAGAVGTIEHVTCHFATPTRDVFAGDKGLDRWRTAFFRPEKSTWQDPEHGGGFAYGQLSHSLAMMFWMTGLDAETVAARRAPGKVDLCDAATVTFAGGAIGMVGGSAAVPQGGRQQLRLFVGGSGGSFTLDVDLDRAELLRHDGANESVARAPGEWVYRCDGPADRLVELAQGRERNWSPGTVGAKTVALIEAIHRSAEAGGAPVAVVR